MKKNKELLKFFLEQLGLWERFEQELESHENLPSWEKIDDNLWAVWEFDCNDESICVANRLSDALYLSKLMNINEFVQYEYDKALADLLEFAGLEKDDPEVMDNIPERAPILRIIEIVNQWAWYKMVEAQDNTKKDA